MTNWPAPDKPGYPADPDRDGIHVLARVGDGQQDAGRWAAADREWWLPGSSLPKSVHWAAAACDYVSAFRTDAAIETAFKKGFAAGRRSAEATIEQTRRTILAEARQVAADRLREARRCGALEMRERAVAIAGMADTDLAARRIGSFGRGPQQGGDWSRQWRSEAILSLPVDTAG